MDNPFSSRLIIFAFLSALFDRNGTGVRKYRAESAGGQASMESMRETKREVGKKINRNQIEIETGLDGFQSLGSLFRASRIGQEKWREIWTV